MGFGYKLYKIQIVQCSCSNNVNLYAMFYQFNLIRIFINKIMSIKAQKCLSPSKENMSPTRHGARGGDPVAELLGFIKASGLKLPSHIEKCLGQEQGGSLLKMIPSEQKNPKQVENLQKLRVKLGDTEFELKKLQEDFAQFKLNSRVDKEKEVKKWQDAYNHLKSTLEHSNEDSSIKLLKLRQSTDKQIQSLKDKHDAQLKQQKQKLTKSYEQKLSSLKKVHERQTKQLKQKSAEEINSLKMKQESQIKQLKESHEAQFKKFTLKHKEIMDAKQKQFESSCIALQSEKKTQQKLHQKTKIEASQAKQKLYSELYFQRNVRKDSQQTIKKRDSQIKSLKSQIHELGVDIVLLKQKSEKKQKELRQQWEKQKIGIEQIHKQKISNILVSHDKELKKYENTIQQINEWKDNKETLMAESYEEIEFKFDERPSRPQDLQAIEKLRSRVARKEEQVRLLNKELKACVMESENKQETYNKIFTSNTMNKFEKKCLAKDRQQFRSKDSLCRKSQTTDIKFLLKVYNKHI